MKSFLTIAMAIVAAWPGAALAQPPDPPSVEFGAQASAQTGQLGAVTWSPRITLNLSPLTAVEAAADFRPRDQVPFGASISGQAGSVHWRQALLSAGRWQVFGVLGAGASRRVQNLPEQIFEGRDGPQVFPAQTLIDSSLAVHLGPAVQFEAARWLALRGDLRLTLSHTGGLRGMVGAVVPLGAFRAGNRPSLFSPTPARAEWQRLRPGHEVWITTASGSLVHGEIASVSGANINVLQQLGPVAVPIDDVRLIEGRDSLLNGAAIGAGGGALSGAVLFGWAASAFCESDPCNSVEGFAIVLGAASGVAVGGLLGAMVDGLIPGRQTLFERSSIRVAPMVTPTSKTLGVSVNWR